MIKKIILFLTITGIIAVIVPAHLKITSVFSDGIPLPILMYHSVLPNDTGKSDYIISTAKFEEDIIYLKKNGYTPISCMDLIKYTQTDSTLPEKPILITFDDGMYNNFVYALPLLEKYKFTGLFSLVGSYTDEYSENGIKNPEYSYISWQEISDFSSRDSVELANHSYNLHSIKERYGTQKKNNEKFTHYLQLFLDDTEKMQNAFLENCNYSPVIYTYPFGGFCDESERILKKQGFFMTLSCIEGINKITKNPTCLYLLKRYNRSGKLSSYEFFKKTGL